MVSKQIFKKITGLRGKNAFQYSLDHADEGVISGWCLDTKDTNKHLSVQLHRDGVVVFATKADVYRGDLAEAKIGNGDHAFFIELNRLSHLNQGDLIDVYIEDTKINEANVVVNYPTPVPTQIAEKIPEEVAVVPEPAAPIEQVDHLQDYRIQIDVSAPGLIAGWIMDRARPAHRAQVECWLNEQLLESTTANRTREDLVVSKVGDESGAYAFDLQYSLAKLPDADCQLVLKVDGHRFVADGVDFALLSSAIVEAKAKQKLTRFNKLVREEISAIGEQIKHININDGLPADTVSGVINVLIERVAELTARCAVLEQALQDKNGG